MKEKILIILLTIISFFPSLMAFSVEKMTLTQVRQYEEIIDYLQAARKGDIDKYKVVINKCNNWMKDHPEEIIYPELLSGAYRDYYEALKKRGIDKPVYLEKAVEIIDFLAKREKEYAKRFIYLGVICEQAGNIQLAKEINQKLKKYLPNEQFLDMILYDKIERQRFLEEATSTLKLHKELDRIAKERKINLRDIKGLDVAKLKKQISALPTSLEQREKLLIYYTLQGPREKALEESKTILKISPDNELAKLAVEIVKDSEKIKSNEAIRQED